MQEYEAEILIKELQKLIIKKQQDIDFKDFEIKRLKGEVERLENLLTPKNLVEV